MLFPGAVNGAAIGEIEVSVDLWRWPMAASTARTGRICAGGFDQMRRAHQHERMRLLKIYNEQGVVALLKELKRP